MFDFLDLEEIFADAVGLAIGFLIAGVVLGMFGFTGMEDVAQRVRDRNQGQTV